jgi:DNA polymerase-3 subunit epsilon
VKTINTHNLFAILDIESTGGKYNEEGITEIAIYKHDGHQIVDQFISLINPEREIQAFVVGLTGINNEMLRSAPKFYEVAKRIVEITQDCVLVAHNAKFDYRILQTEFSRLGFDYQRKSICTVELSKQLLPHVKSYSLGKLVKELGIPMTSRHRASGDALATVQLFEMLLTKDVNKNIVQQSIRTNPIKHKDTKLIRLLEDIPNLTGVYYFYDEEGKIIYIGKSRNIKKRVNQHFTNDNPKSKKIQQKVARVSYELTGNELIALLKENNEIKSVKPTFNTALKKHIFSHGLYVKTNKEGYLCFSIGTSGRKDEPLTTFTSAQQAKQRLHFYIEEYSLCASLCGLHKTKGACFNYTIKKCHGACLQKESVASYNERANQLIERYTFERKNLVITDRGRKNGEKSFVLIKNGTFVGYGFVNLGYQLTSLTMAEKILTPMEEDRDARHILHAYLKKNLKRLVISEVN